MVALWGIFTIANLIGFIILFFIIAIISKQVNDFGMAFNKWLAWATLLVYFIVDKFLPLKWAILIGLASALLVGFFGGSIFGGDDESGGD